LQKEGKSKRRLAWGSICLVCKAVLDFVFTIGVGVLAIIVCLLAYVTTIDEAPMPGFLVRLLENELKAQGASLRMSGIRIRPSGRVTIDQPQIFSTDLESEIARAERISLKVDRALLLFGKTRLTHLEIVDGSLITPAILSKTGVPEAQVDQIDFMAENQLSGWAVKQFQFQFGNARASLNGIVDLDEIELPKPKDGPKPLTEQLVLFHKRASELKQQLSQVRGLEARLRLEAPDKRPKSLSAVITALDGHWKDQASAE